MTGYELKNVYWFAGEKDGKLEIHPFVYNNEKTKINVLDIFNIDPTTFPYERDDSLPPVYRVLDEESTAKLVEENFGLCNVSIHSTFGLYYIAVEKNLGLLHRLEKNNYKYQTTLLYKGQNKLVAQDIFDYVENVKKTFDEIISYKKTFLRALKKARKQELKLEKSKEIYDDIKIRTREF